MVSLRKQVPLSFFFAPDVRQQTRDENLWAYLTAVYDYGSASEILVDLNHNDPRGMSLLLQLHFHYDNVTGELVNGA